MYVYALVVKGINPDWERHIGCFRSFLEAHSEWKKQILIFDSRCSLVVYRLRFGCFSRHLICMESGQNGEKIHTIFSQRIYKN